MMKNLLTLLLCCLTSIIFAQDTYHNNLKAYLQSNYGLTGGTWVFASSEITNANNIVGSGGTKTISTVTGQPFTRSVKLAVTTLPLYPWHAGLSLNTSAALAVGDRVLLVYWARTVTAPQNIGKAAHLFTNNTTYTNELDFEPLVGTTWKQYFIPFTIKTLQPLGGAQFALQTGFQLQTMEIAGLTMLNYQQTVPFASLPLQTNEEYDGMASNAPWRADADARIDQYRKANLGVKVTDINNQPLNGVQVKMEMLQHLYPFGTAINENLIAGNPGQNNTYQNKLLNLDGNGHGFNQVVSENGMKWVGWEQNWTTTKANKVKAVKWLADRNIATRGHNLIWPSWGNSPSDLQANQTNLPYLTNRMNGRIDEMLNYTGLKGFLKEWDVINEPTGSNDIANAFKNSPGYPTGREIYIDNLNRAKQTDSTVKRYINESHVSYFYVNEPNFRNIVQQTVNGGGKVDGIGFESHYRTLWPPETIYNYYTDYHNITGGAIKVTEYDQKTLAPDSLEAKFFGDLLTITFSHPYSEGFLMWGFWDGAHYGGRAPLFDINWNLKPEGQPFINLVFNKWWTPDSTKTTATNGTISERAFKGRYKITITRNGQQMIDTVMLSKDSVYTYKLQTTTLPLRWVSFEVSKQSSSTALLSWVVSNEIDNNYFLIEKSNNGIDFSVIGTIQSSGNASYNYTDNNFSDSKAYYRIKQVDKDGKFSYSLTKILDASSSSNKYWRVYPTLLNKGENINIQFNSNAGSVKMYLTDISGKILFQKNIYNSFSNQIVSVPTDNLGKGVYLLNVSNNIYSKTEKVILQ